MIVIVVVCALLAHISNAQILPVTNLFPDCVSGSLTPACAVGGNVVQTTSANPVASLLVSQGWAFTANQLAPSLNWRIYSSITTALSPSPITSSLCTAGNGLTFQNLGSQNTAGTGTIWFVVYLAQPSTASSPVILLSSGNGCTYSYSTSSAIRGGPAYFYTNIDDGSHPEIVFRSQLNPPIKSSTCTNPAADSSLGVSTIAVTSVAAPTASFVLIYAGFVAGPSASQINCFGSFRFLFPTSKLSPIPVKTPGFFSKGKRNDKVGILLPKSKGNQLPAPIIIIPSKKKGKGGPKMTSFTRNAVLADDSNRQSSRIDMDEQL